MDTPQRGRSIPEKPGEPKKPKPPNEPEWYSSRIHDQILIITYVAVPALVIVLDVYTFTLACRAEGLHGVIPATLVFFVTTLLGRYLIDLLVFWRQVQRSKHNELSEQDTRLDLMDWIRGWRSPFQKDRGIKNEKERRFRREAEFRASLQLCEYGALLIAAVFSAIYLRLDPKLAVFPRGRLTVIGIVFGIALSIWWYLFRRQDAAWRKSLSNPDGPMGSKGHGGSTASTHGGNGGGGAGEPPRAAGETRATDKPKSPTTEGYLDFSQKRAAELWFKPDAWGAVKVVIAFAAGFVLSFLSPVTEPVAGGIIHRLGVEPAAVAKYILAIVAAAVFVGTVIGYVRLQLSEIGEMLERDRDNHEKTTEERKGRKLTRKLKERQFSDYVGREPTRPGNNDDETNG